MFLTKLDRWCYKQIGWTPFVFLVLSPLSKVKLWWNRLWIRSDEFHHSLDIDIKAMSYMNAEQQKKYIADLCHRREIAHQRDR